jgi:hypothetical protein
VTGEALPHPDAQRSDAVFKTFVEAALLLAIAGAYFVTNVSFGILVVASIALVIGSLAADAYLFGSVGRAFAARRRLHFKASPFIVMATLFYFILPAETDLDKFVRFALAAGVGGIVTGLLNLEPARRKAKASEGMI